MKCFLLTFSSLANFQGGVAQLKCPLRDQNDLKPLLEEKLDHQNSRGKLQNKSQEKMVPKKMVFALFSSSQLKRRTSFLVHLHRLPCVLKIDH